MDPSNVFTYNPLAPDFLQGIDPETPPGYEDVYAEHAVDIAFPTGDIQNGQLLFPWPFLVRVMYASSDNGLAAGSEIGFNFRLTDMDGEDVMESRCRVEAASGIGQAPLPIVPEMYIAQGEAITWEAQDES
jgi:hypothetical protein